MLAKNEYFAITHGWCIGRRAIICDTISKTADGAISKFLKFNQGAEWKKLQQCGFNVTPLELEVVAPINAAATGCSVDERSIGPTSPSTPAAKSAA